MTAGPTRRIVRGTWSPLPTRWRALSTSTAPRYSLLIRPRCPTRTSPVPRTDDEHGSITTYFVPTENLPLTQVFRDVGVPDALVDKADQVLRPIVDAGYRRHDEPGDPRPYLSEGRIHRNVQSVQQVRERWREESGDAQEPSVNPGQQLQAGGDDRLDQNDPTCRSRRTTQTCSSRKTTQTCRSRKNDPDAQQSRTSADG